MKNNKFIDFINNNDITTPNQAYVITKILCNKDSTDVKKAPYLWIKLLSVKKFNNNGVEVKQIYINDFFTREIDKYKDLCIGELVNCVISQVVGRQCRIVELASVGV